MKTTTREQILNCSNFNQLLNAEYGKRGTRSREQFEAEAEAFVLGELLKQERKTAGLTQQQLAEQSGYNKTTISRLEKGSSNVSLSSIFHIFAGMGRRVAISVLTLTLLFTLSVGQMWGAWIGNSGINVNDTWYRSTNNIDGGNWLASCTYFQDKDFGAITSLVLGGQYDTWDNNQTDYCSWNASNGIHILIKKGSTEIANFKLSCYHDSKSGNNNVWKTSGGTGGCSDSGSWGTYTVDLSGYAAGNDYTIKVTWFSPSGQSLNNTAKFTIAPVVTFKANGGTGSDYTQRVTYNTNTALTANTFTKTGYNFAGWATSASGSVTYADKATVKLTAHTTLHAKWTAKTSTINFNQQGGSGGSSSVTATYDAAMPSATMPTRSGYTFGGYFTAVGGGGTKYYNADGSSAKTCDLTSTTTLYAKWTQTITLDEQGATTSGTTSKSVTYNSNAGMSTMITAPSKTGYDYGGYYTDVAGGGYQIINNRTWQASVSGYTDASKNWIHSGATTIYAKWTQTVTLNANTSYHGSGSNKSATATWNGTALSGFTATAAATGYNLIGYYSAVSSGTKVLNADGTYAASNVTNYITSGKWTKAGATTLYAHMQAKTYSVTLDKNGGDSGGSTTATYNSNLLADFSGASYEGYSCDGYFTASDGGTKIINADGTLVDGTVAGWLSSGYWVKDAAGITLYAHWTEDATYYTLHYTYGTGLSARFSSIAATKTSGGDAIADNTSLVSGTGVTLTATPADHYRFVGWYSAAGCAANTLVSTDNPYSFSMSDNTNLYAKAELMTTVITLNANGGAGGSSSVTATHGSSTISSYTAPTRSGYTFNGWYTEESGGTRVLLAAGTTPASVSGYTDGSGNWIYTGAALTLYGHWTAKTYKVTFDKQSGSSGSDNVTATYNAAMPSATMPMRTGYDFQGYYGSTGGSGTKYYNADGSSAHVWDVASATTIYANWSIKNYSITYSPASAPTGCTYTTKPTSADYNSTVTMVITPSTGYTVSVSARDASSNVVTVSNPSANTYTFTQPASAVTVTVAATETMHTITINDGTAASTTAGISTTGSATAAAPAEGKKFTGWTLGSGVTLSGGALTDRTINFTATQASSVTANYADRASVKMYFAKPTNASWSTVYAYAWQNGGSAKNANYPGIELSTTETINCIVYYIYQYYTEEDGIGGAATGNSAWNRIIFGDNNNDRKTGDLTISNGHYYYWNSSTTGSATAKTTAWYIKGTMNSWGESDPVIIDCDTHSGSANIALTGGTQYEFKVYDDVSTKMMSNSTACGNITSSTSAETLYTDDANSMRITPPVSGTYTFTVGSVNTTTPTIAVTFPTALSIYRSNPNDATNVGDHPWDTHVGNEFTWALDLEANTTYEFKINQEGSYYGYDASNITTSISATTFSIGTNDTKLITKSAGTFNFTWNSSTHKLSIQYPKSVVVTVSPVSVYTGGTTTLTGTASELGSGSHTITYEFFKGTTLTDANKIATKNKTATGASQSVTQDVTVDFAGNDMSQVYTIRIKESGNILATNVVTVYRKWDIYVNDVCSWGAMKLYNWDASGSYPVAFPGTAQPLVGGSTHWHKVTLDARYPNFKLSKQSGTESGNHTASIATYGAGTYWYLNNCQTLTKVTISTPTVTISATVTNATQINLTGNITNFGGDDTKASKMKEVYFNVNGSKDATGVTASDSHTFTKTLNNPTASASPANTLQAFATNIGYTGSSSTLNFTNVTLDMQSGASGTAAVLAVNGVAMASGATAPTRTGYTFGGYYAAANGSGTQYYNADMTSATNWDQTTATKTLYAKWTANTYSVHFDGNGATSGEMADETGFTYDVSKALTANAFERTGYTFQGWATAPDGAKVYNDGQSVSNLSSTNGATVTLYAVWQAKTYLVTLDKRAGTTGYRSSGTWTNPTVTYDATPTTMSGTAPGAADGYGFMGFYTETDGGGLQLIDKTGAWQASKEGYTDASAHWIHDGAVTVYAYYKQAEIITLNFVASIVQPSSTVQVTPVVEPAPEGDTHIEWRILYDNNNPLDPQPAKTTYNTTGIQFTSSASSGSYKVEATLKTGLVEGAGTELSTKAVAFQVAGEHTITVKYVSGSYTIQPATEAPGLPLDWTSITAPALTGYTFSRWVAGEGITIENPADPGTPSIATTATIRYKAIYDGVLTAEYTKKRLIYFYNTLGWSDVNVYFYKNNSYWGTAGQGTGANTAYAFTNTPYSEGLHGQMLPIAEGSNIYYFDAEAAGVNASYTTVAFTELAQHGSNYFYNHNKVIRRDDYKSTALPMFVPLAEQEAVHRNGGAADYYDKGYWMNYPENTGYTLKIYNNAYADKATGVVREFAFPFSDDKKMPLKMDVEFNDNGTHEYWFMVYRNDGTYLGNTYVFNQNYNAEQIITGGENKSKLITSAPGKYNFMLTYHDNGSGTTNYYIDVDFPIAVGDYRIVYQDNAKWSMSEAHTASWNHPSDVINKIAGDATEAKKDTVSFFVAKGTGITASMKFQYASAINETTGAITWTDVTGGSITIPTDVVTEAGVYNFIVSQPVGGASIALEKAEPYTGNFYIRTDIAGNTKWDSYKANDHLMQYSDYAAENENFTHYYAHWVERNTNIKFVIANDYSPCISDTLIKDEDYEIDNMTYDSEKGEYTGTLRSQWPEVQDPTFDMYSANIRFMYNEKTNKISRAYVSGSSNIEKFIIMHGASAAPKIYDENGAELPESGLLANAINLVDDQNFIYETTIMANPTTRIKLTAEYSGVVQYFKGDDNPSFDGESGVEILGGTYTSASIKEKMRVIYDFKTNRLVCAWLPSGEIDGDKVIDADVMIIREHQGDAQQISFKNNKDDLSGVKYVYGVMRFNRWDLANKDRNTHEPLAVGASIYERRMYFISFPFDVNLGDIFGLGRYDDHWWIQYYDGADRANKGFFQESTTFWKFMENTKDAKLKANEGYILTLGSEMLRSDNMDIWVNEINQVELFFPSADVVNTIEKTDATVTLEELPCTINHNTVEPGQPGYIPDIDRRKRDSHWHCMGVPSYANYSSYLKDGSGNNITWSTWSSESFPFLYEWNMQDNTLTPTAASTHLFKTMHAYMVQAYGNIEWKATSVIPSSVAARRNADYTGNYMFRLNLMTGGKEAGRTFINLRDDEKVTNNFDFNYDLSNEGGAIYTTTGDFVNVAGNCLPLETEQLTVIPVGVVAKTAGEYTFAMPDGTEGLNVVLFDSQENIHTDLSLTDYTVELPAGTYDNRFYLTIDPRKTTTSIDLVGGEGSEMAPRKVFVNGLMYIIRGNDVYDANGRKLK